MKENKISRRSFLKGAAAMSAAAAGAALGVERAAAEAALYTPGTYTGVAAGFGGEVRVTITVDETKILSAAVEAAGETAGIGSVAAEQLAEKILEIQSHELDVVSGASVTRPVMSSVVPS